MIKKTNRTMTSKAIDYAKVIDYFRKNGSATAKNIKTDLNLPRSNVYNILKNLHRDGQIKKLRKSGKTILYATIDYEPLEERIKRSLPKICGKSYMQLIEERRVITPNHFDAFARQNNIDPSTDTYRKAVNNVRRDMKLDWLYGNPGHYGNQQQS